MGVRTLTMALAMASTPVLAAHTQAPCLTRDSLWSVAPQHFSTPQDVPLRPGRYRFYLVATSGPAIGGRAEGILELWPVPVGREHPPNPTITYLLHGASNIALSRVGSPSVAYPVSSRSPDSAGVEVSFDGGSGTASLSLGNAYSPTGMIVDAGTLMWVLASDSKRVTGRWRDGGLSAPPAGGFFCLDRLPQR